MKSFVIYIVLLLIPVFIYPQIVKPVNEALVIYNSKSPEIKMTKEYLIPYLQHFWIPYDTLNFASPSEINTLDNYNLIILGHDNIVTDELSWDKLNKLLSTALKNGIGIVSFAPGFRFSTFKRATIQYIKVKFLEFTSDPEYITAWHKPNEFINLPGELTMPVIRKDTGKYLIVHDKYPLLTVKNIEKGKYVLWTSMEWMKTTVLGPMGGLDDCLWRSFIYAARKPFIMRGLPPIVTMRVDDVTGWGGFWYQSPLYWVSTANKYGFKPWLGLFILNLSPLAINELRGYLEIGQATAFPHALGRPVSAESLPRFLQYFSDTVNDLKNLYYDSLSLLIQKTNYDDFLYFNHIKKSPWSAKELSDRLEIVDRWYKKNRPLPMSNYVVAHYYEMGSNVLSWLYDTCKVEFIAQPKEFDKPWDSSVPWIKQGPFRLYENPGKSTADESDRGRAPVYYADFYQYNNYKFFNCVSEVRDLTNYEWAPSNDVEATADRAIMQLRRALSGMELAVLFTHESTYLSLVNPINWEKEIKLISEAITDFNPMYLCMDDAVKIVRSTKTSKFGICDLNSDPENVIVDFTGYTDTDTYFYLFTEKDSKINQQLIKVPLFHENITMKIPLKKNNKAEGVKEEMPYDIVNEMVKK